jgi:hypothetical protein
MFTLTKSLPKLSNLDTKLNSKSQTFKIYLKQNYKD